MKSSTKVTANKIRTEVSVLLRHTYGYNKLMKYGYGYISVVTDSYGVQIRLISLGALTNNKETSPLC